MAKSAPKPSIQFTHEHFLTLLNDAWTTQFLKRASYDLRKQADAFFTRAVLVTSPAQNLDQLAPLASSFREILNKHQTEVAEGKVTLDALKPAPKDWYAAFRSDTAGLFKALRAPVGSTDAGAPQSSPSSQRPLALALVAAPRTETDRGPAGVTSEASFSAPASSAAEAPFHNVEPNDTAPRREAPSDTTTPTGVPPEPTAPALEKLDWPLPARLAEARGPTFPCDALSPWLAAFVGQLADQTQVYVDVPAVWTLAAFGAAAAKGVLVEVQRGDRHPTNLWTLAVMPSGGGKSPTLDEIRRPFDERQLELRASARDARARRETELRVTRRRLRSLEKEAADAEDVSERESILEQCATMQASIFDLERPAMPTLTTGDPTQASLTQLMDENDGRILLLTDEGDQLFTRIGGGEGIEAMLQAHSGATIERTRAGRHEIRIVAPSLSLVLGIQPGPFARVMANRAYHDKGFLARMLFVVLESKNGARKQLRAGVEDATRHDYQIRIRRLLELSSKSPITLTLAPAALSTFSTFAARVDRDIALGGLAEVQEWGNKLRSVTARVAGVLHAADHALTEAMPSEITLETMQRAIRIAEYFEAHALVAYGDAIRSAEDEGAKKVWRWIADSGVATFRQADAVRALNGRLSSAEVSEAINRLVDEGYLRMLSARRSTGGRPPKPAYRVHPLLVGPTEKTDKSV